MRFMGWVEGSGWTMTGARMGGDVRLAREGVVGLVQSCEVAVVDCVGRALFYRGKTVVSFMVFF